MTPHSRRVFLQGAGIGLLSFTVAGAELMLTPRQARASGADFKILTPAEVATLEALGEILVPGSAEAGLANFLDQQLAVEPNDCLLMARYLNVEPPYTGFYKGGLAAVERLSAQLHERPFAELDQSAAIELVKRFSASEPEGWEGPPAPLVYLLIRSDAIDVVYGTVEGFARMNIPYMPHILPPEKW